jgi:Secretion system C-terminal sorting domain/PKD domain
MQKKFFQMLAVILLFAFQSKAQGTCTSCFTTSVSPFLPNTVYLDAFCSTPTNPTYQWIADGVSYGQIGIGYYQITFPTFGTHTITLVVSDNGCSDTSTQTIITSASCDAEFYSYNTASNTAYFNILSAASSTAFYAWDFGDGSTSNSYQSATHTYANPGTYYVCLTIGDSIGSTCSDVFCDSVTVASLIPNNCNPYIVINYPSVGNTYTADASFSQYDTSNYLFAWSVNGIPLQQSTNPIFTFNYTGPIFDYVQLDITDTLGNICNSTVQNVFGPIGGGGNGCYACFTYNPLSLNYDSVIADATCSNLQANGSIAWKIDYVLAATTDSITTFTFTTNGYHYITLITKDSLGNACDSTTQYVYIVPPPCFSCLTVNPVAGSTSDYVFDGTCSNGTANSSYTWVVDNTVITSTSNSTFNYSFTQSGTYNVCLYVIDNVLGTYCNQACATVVVNTPQQTQFDLCGTIVKVDSNYIYTTATANEAIVYLVTLASGGILDAIDSTTTDAFGQYCFNNLPVFDYRIKAALKPTSSVFSQNIPTYYQAADMWFNANVITLANTNTYNRDVYMNYGTNLGGPGIITGNVFLGANKPSRSNLGLDGLSIMLVDELTNKTVAYAKTDIGGTYTFNNLPLGKYKVYGEAINKQSIPAIVDVTATNPLQDDVNMEVNKNVINPSNQALSIGATVKKLIGVYPNPTDGLFTIQNLSSNATIAITDITGKLVEQLELKANAKQTYNTINWRKGIYFVTVQSGDTKYTEKLSVQ